MIDITPAWRPKEITSKALLNAGFSQDQLDTIGKIFVERYDGQNIANAGSMFSKMVRDSGNGHDIKQSPDNAVKKILAKQADKSKDGEKRAQEAKQQEGILTKQEAIAWYDGNR